jgi:hypothetical protein
MYELCQNGKVQTASESQLMNYEAFILEEKYNRYALLNERAASCKTRIKRIVRPRQCDVYFEFTEERKGRTVEMLRFKLFRKMP